MKAIPDIIKIASRDLRKNMTKSETILWNKLRAKRFLGIKFQRQSPIFIYTEDSGLDRFIIPDFICFDNKLIIELDGSVHNIKEVYLLDKEKEKLLKNLGYTILRFKNEEILSSMNSVLNKIKENSE